MPQSARLWAKRRVCAGCQPPNSVASYQYIQRHLPESAIGLRVRREWLAFGVERDATDVGECDVRCWRKDLYDLEACCRAAHFLLLELQVDSVKLCITSHGCPERA